VRPIDRLLRFVAQFTERPEPAIGWGLTVKHAVGAFLAILFLGAMLDRTSLPLMIAPFGASTLLLFSRPRSPLAQPANVIGGYLICAACAFVSAAFLPGVLWATAASLALALAAMSRLRVTHPPAGALPLIAFADPLTILVVIEAIVVGSLTLIALAVLYHRIPPRQRYPDPGEGRDEG
jgi:CBS-domain-containing membrane protein